MKQELRFDDKHVFLTKLEELAQAGKSLQDLEIVTPYPVHEVDEILHPPQSHLRFFTLIGAALGLVAGFALTIFTSLDYPLITGGKPIVSIPAYVIIAFELTILFGALITFAGFLLLARLPDLKSMIEPVEYGNQFVILIDDEES